MDFMKKVETLLNATARSPLPRRGRRSVLDEQEEQILTEIRRALAAITAQEQVLARRIKTERTQAQEAAQTGDRANQQAHQRRAAEMERELEQESIQAIDLEEKLRALEEKLAQAKAAVEQQMDVLDATLEEEEAKALALGGETQAPDSTAGDDSPAKKLSPADFPDDDPDIAVRKSRLAG
jgi:hypothetical protein